MEKDEAKYWLRSICDDGSWMFESPSTNYVWAHIPLFVFVKLPLSSVDILGSRAFLFVARAKRPLREGAERSHSA